MMMRSLAIAMMLAGWVGTTSAHHGITGQFDTSTTFEISGVVTQMNFVNPHSYVHFDVTTDTGNVVPWRCEMRGATVLRRSAWTEEMFSPGTEITIKGSPDRRDSQTCYLVTVTFSDGRTLERYQQLRDVEEVERPLRLANGQPNINGDWAAPQLILPGDAALGQRGVGGFSGFGIGGMGGTGGMGIPVDVEPTAAGLEAIARFDNQRDNPRLNCQPTNIFLNWYADFNVNQIVQRDDSITLRYGFMDLMRVIHLDISEHPDDIVPSRAGHSIGRWEDDVLVVDTIGFEPGLLGSNARQPLLHSDQLHTVERFVPEPENKALVRYYVADDPLYFTGQYAGQDTVYVSDIPFDTVPCTDLKDDRIQPTN